MELRSESPTLRMPIRMCYCCGEFGHTSKFCTREEKCLVCAGSHSRNPKCEAPFSCINCKGPHKTLDRRCPIYLQNVDIMRRMAHDNLSYLEARRVVEGLHSTSREVPTQNMKSFPPLPVQDKGERSNFKDAVLRGNSPKDAEEMSRKVWKRIGVVAAPVNLQDFLGTLLSKIADMPQSEKLFQRLWKTMHLHVLNSNNGP